MITKFQIFESKYSIPEEGDIVVCVDNYELEDNLILGKKYKIKSVWNKKIGSTMCDVEDIETGDIQNGFYLDRFAKEIEYNANKYNL